MYGAGRWRPRAAPVIVTVEPVIAEGGLKPVIAGVSLVTVAVCVEVAGAPVPEALVALSRTRMLWPTSAAASRYGFPSRRRWGSIPTRTCCSPSHWSAIDVGLNDHSPCVTVSVCPCSARPEMAGGVLSPGLSGVTNACRGLRGCRRPSGRRSRPRLCRRSLRRRFRCCRSSRRRGQRTGRGGRRAWRRDTRRPAGHRRGRTRPR